MIRTPSTLALLLLSFAARAQNGQDQPSFEVASIKAVQSGHPGTGPLRGGPGTSSPGQLTGTATLKALLMRAYSLKNYQITGSGWMDTERFQIAAKIPSANASQHQVSLMLQSLLRERFHLAVHKESRQLPVFALLAGKNGLKITESAAADPKANAPPADGEPLTGGAVPKLSTGPDGLPDIASGSDVPRSYEVVLRGSDGILYKLWARRETMEELADRLSSQLSRAVVDMTGLKGQFDFTLVWSMEGVGGSIPRTDPPPDVIESNDAPVITDSALSIFAAVQAQLGLKLEQRRGRLDMLVVDRVERTPTGN